LGRLRGRQRSGVFDCARYDAVFADAVVRRVADPLAERGIPISDADVRAVVQAAALR
jgi:hypothetical protein